MLTVDDRSRLLQMAPGRLWVQDLGPREPAEPPLVLLHSLLVTGWDFRYLVEPLARAGRRVIAPDLFGCGSSDRPAPADAAGYSFDWHAELLTHMIEELGLDTLDLLGHGYGASVAIHLARRLEARRAGAVRRVCLIAPYCVPAAAPVASPIALPAAVPALRRAWRWVGFSPLVYRTVFRRADLRRFLRRSLSTPELLERPPLPGADEQLPDLRDDVDVYWDRLCRDGGLEALEAMLGQLDALRDSGSAGAGAPLAIAARSLACPVMLVWGDRDEILPTPLATRCAALFEQAQLRIVEGCGHAPHRERPEAMLEILDTFERRMHD